MSNYFGHIAISCGKITIDLGGKVLEDGIYSIVQEAKIIGKRKESKHNPKFQQYDKEEFKKKVIGLLDGKKMPISELAKTLGMPANTLTHRLKSLNMLHLFKLRKPVSEYAP